MTTFAILNRTPTQDLTGIVKAHYPDAHIWSPNVAFVRDTASATEVSGKLEIQTKSGDSITGKYTQIVVVEIAPNYWGFTESSLWGWLKASFESTA